MTTPAATAALARALHEETGAQHFIVPGSLPNGDETEWQECIGHAEDHEEDAAAILAHDFTPAERAALAAVLLTPEVLAEALDNHQPDDLRGNSLHCGGDDWCVRRILAALAAIGAA